MINTIVFKGLGYAQYATQLTSAIALTSATTSGSTLTAVRAAEFNEGRQAPVMVLLQATGQNVRWTDDGTTPTATVGMLLYAGGDPYPYTGDLTKLQFIQVAATAVLNVSYYAAV